jgi:hypothetical protein
VCRGVGRKRHVAWGPAKVSRSRFCNPEGKQAYHGITALTIPEQGPLHTAPPQVIYRQHFGPLMSGVHIANYPYCLHCKWQEARGHVG